MNKIVIKNEKLTEPGSKKLSNRISTTLYRVYNFLPLSIFNQVIKITNVYFIIIAILSIFPQISTISPYSAVLPVLFVIFFTVSFDLYDDFKRYLRDRVQNQKQVLVLKDKKWINIFSEQISVGDIVKHQENEEICADLLLLTHSSNCKYAFIKTANLDGEKNLKPKISILEENLTEENMFIKNPFFELTFNENTESLFKFTGSLNFSKKIGNDELMHQDLSISNFLPKSCIVKNTESVIGIVVYTGMDTKIMLNTKQRRLKTSTLEQQMNSYIIYIIGFLFCVLILVSTYSVLITQNNQFFMLLNNGSKVSPFIKWITTFASYFLILSTVLPISLIVTLQLVKTFITLTFKNKNQLMNEVEANTVNIHEELGQIGHILSDKTGTLTRNKMIVKRFQIATNSLYFDVCLDRKIKMGFQKLEIFSMDKKDSLKIHTSHEMEKLFFILINTCHECFAGKIKENVIENRRPTIIVENGIQIPKLEKFSIPQKKISITKKAKSFNKRMTENYKISSGVFIQGNPRLSEFDKISQTIEIQGPSPDEIALLKVSKVFCGYVFKGSSINESIVHSKYESEIRVQIHLVNKFDSIRRMMTIVSEVDDKIILFVKGADSTICPLLKKDKNEIELDYERLILKKTKSFVKAGLRTLFFAIKVISRDEWNTIASSLQTAKLSKSSEQETVEILKNLEQNLTLIGVSGIEDELQLNLSNSIEQIKKADIKFWMVTGDMLETAENIAFNAGMFDLNKPVLTVKSLEDIHKIKAESQNIVVDGSFFGEIFGKKDENFELFKKKIVNCLSVVFGRTNANQKIQIVQMVKSTGVKTLAIGDGANDVNMIQEADVGVGIDGEEGRQASNSADFVIKSFSSLPDLIFNHGRLSMYQISELVIFFFYKNFLFTFPQILFGFFNGFTKLPIFSSWYMTFFNLLFTAFPVAAKALFDCDFEHDFGKNAREIEIATYFLGKEGMRFNFWRLFAWLILGAFEVSVVFFIGDFAYYDKPYSYNHEITYEFFSMLMYGFIIFHLELKIIYMTNKFNLFQWFSYVLGILTFVIYFLITNLLAKLGFYQMNEQIWFNPGFLMILLFCVFFVFTLSVGYSKIQSYFFPTLLDFLNKKMETGNMKSIGKNIEEWKNNHLKKKK